MSVTVTVTIDGAPLRPDLADNLASLEVVESLDSLGAASIELVVPPTTERSAVLALAKPGALVGVTLTGEAGASGSMQGDLVEVQHRDGVGRALTLQLRVLDRLHRLRGRPRTKVWEGAHSTIARTIATECGFTPRVQAVEATSDYTFQANVPDGLFLRQLAARYNYAVRLEGRSLVFGRRNLPAGAGLTLTWGVDVVDLKLAQSLDGLVTDVTALGWSAVTNTPLRATVSCMGLRNLSRGTTGASLVQTAFGPVWLRLDNQPAQNLSELFAVAIAELQRRAEGYVRGRIETRGSPSAAPGQPMILVGCPGYAGTYLIREVRHTWLAGTGFRSAIEFFSDSMPPVSA